MRPLRLHEVQQGLGLKSEEHQCLRQGKERDGEELLERWGTPLEMEMTPTQRDEKMFQLSALLNASRRLY